MSGKQRPDSLTTLRALLSKRKGWIFPLFLTFGLLVLTLLSISGSSVGVYDSLLNQNNDSLITGTPRPDRSDEWLVNTPLTLSQQANDYTTRNPLIGDGSDVSVVVDVPFKDWSSVFHPQNLAFYVLPFSMAFAFKWWFLLYALLLAIYWFILTIAPKRYALAAGLALLFGFSPYVQWWYQSVTILPVVGTLLAICLALRLLKPAVGRRRRVLLALALGYVLSCFVLTLYPPFQISCALFGLVTFFALLSAKMGGIKQVLGDKKMLWLVPPLLLVAIVTGAFLIGHHDTISIEKDTVYPGSRIVDSGGTSARDFGSWPLHYLLLKGGPTSVFGTNQSETAQFMLFGLLLLPYLLYVFTGVRLKVTKKSALPPLDKSHRYLLYGLTGLLAVLFGRIFIPFGTGAFHYLGLASVPHNRLYLSIGLISTVFIAIAVCLPSKKYRDAGSLWSLPAAVMTGAIAVLTFALLFPVTNSNAALGVGKFELLAVSLAIGLLVGLVCHPIGLMRYLGLLGMVVFSFHAAATVNPLYRGFGSLQTSQLSRDIKQLAATDKDSAWIVANKIPFEAIPTAMGAQNYSGAYPYPQNKIWQKYFGSKPSNIYNRFAHVSFNVDDSVNKRNIQYVQQDTFIVNIASCDPMLSELSINYILAVNSTGYACFSAFKDQAIGDAHLQILKRKSP